MATDDRLYFRQLLSGRDFAAGDMIAQQMRNFAYLIGDRETGDCVVVDPAYAANDLLDTLENDGMTLDLSLGAHAGVEMLRHLWVLGCKAPIIIISGCNDAMCRETVRIGKSLNLKILDPVPKPVDLEMLRYSLERLKAEIERAAA